MPVLLCERGRAGINVGVRTVVSGAEAPADYDRQLRHVRTCDCADHLRAIFRDASALSLGADHVAYYVTHVRYTGDEASLEETHP